MRVGLLALVAFAGCAGGHVVNEVFIDPIQADAVAEIDGDYKPSLMATCSGALHSTRALTEELEQVDAIDWEQLP